LVHASDRLARMLGHSKDGRVCALTGAARSARLLHELCNIHPRMTRDAWQAVHTRRMIRMIRMIRPMNKRNLTTPVLNWLMSVQQQTCHSAGAARCKHPGKLRTTRCARHEPQGSLLLLVQVSIPSRMPLSTSLAYTAAVQSCCGRGLPNCGLAIPAAAPAQRPTCLAPLAPPSLVRATAQYLPAQLPPSRASSHRSTCGSNKEQIRERVPVLQVLVR